MHRAIAVTPVVHVPVPVRVTLALKFPRSPFLAHQIKKSCVLPHVRNSYLSHPRYLTPVHPAFKSSFITLVV